MRAGKRVEGLMFAILIAGVIFTYKGATNLIDSQKTRYDINDLKEADFENGMIVEGELIANMGAFEEHYTTTNGVRSKSTGYCYMIPVGEKKYSGYEANHKDDIALLEKQADATYRVLYGESSELIKSVPILGKVKKMPQKTREFLRSYMVQLGVDKDSVDSYILDFYIVQISFQSALQVTLIGAGLMMTAVIGFAAAFLARKRQHGQVKQTIVTDDMQQVDFGGTERYSFDSNKGMMN